VCRIGLVSHGAGPGTPPIQATYSEPAALEGRLPDGPSGGRSHHKQVGASGRVNLSKRDKAAFF